jgi:hypothetical protein
MTGGDSKKPTELLHVEPSDAGDVDAMGRLARLYLSPLARLFDLAARLDEQVSGRWFHDQTVWKQEVASIVHTLRDEKLRLKAIEPAARMAMRSQGGQRRIVTDAAAELSTKVAEASNHHDGVKAQIRKLLGVMGERMIIYGTDFPELGLSDQEEFALKNHVADQLKRPRSHRRGAGGGSQAISAYVGPIQGLARALEHFDFVEIERELRRVSAHILERLERRSAELDAVICRGPALDAAQRREWAARNFDFRLESIRLPLIDLAIAGILRCLGGEQRIATELAFRETRDSVAPTDPRAEEILERLSEDIITRGKSLEPAEPAREAPPQPAPRDCDEHS